MNVPWPAQGDDHENMPDSLPTNERCDCIPADYLEAVATGDGVTINLLLSMLSRRPSSEKMKMIFAPQFVRQSGQVLWVKPGDPAASRTPQGSQALVVV